jgi:hypothetical protein
MRGYFLIIFSMATVVPSILLARSEETPTLDVSQVCRGIASQSADPLATGLMKDNLEECVKSEQGVREEIKAKWSTFSAGDKQTLRYIGEDRRGIELYGTPHLSGNVARCAGSKICGRILVWDGYCQAIRIFPVQADAATGTSRKSCAIAWWRGPPR